MFAHKLCVKLSLRVCMNACMRELALCNVHLHVCVKLALLKIRAFALEQKALPGHHNIQTGKLPDFTFGWDIYMCM